MTSNSKRIFSNISFKKTIPPHLLEPPEEISGDLRDELHSKKEYKPGTADLFNNPTLLKNLLIMSVIWIVVTLGN